jgi:drug/metabolite transporter (DMT)-like permease
MKNVKAYTTVCAAMLLFGMSFVWTRDLVRTDSALVTGGLLPSGGFPAQSLSMFRMLISGVLLILFLLFTKRFRRIEKQDVKWFLLLALFEPFIYFLGENNGVRLTSASLGSVVLSTVPVFTMLACFCVFKERPTWTNIVGVLFTIPGVALVMLNDRFQLDVPVTGVALLFVASLSTAGYAVIIRKLQKYSAFTIGAFQNLLGALYFLPLVLLFEREPLAAVQWSSWSVAYPLVMLSVFVSACAFVLFVSSIKKIGITQANMFSALIPIITTIAVFFMRPDESLTTQQIIGVLVVISGVVLSQWQRSAGERSAGKRSAGKRRTVNGESTS